MHSCTVYAIRMRHTYSVIYSIWLYSRCDLYNHDMPPVATWPLYSAVMITAKYIWSTAFLRTVRASIASRLRVRGTVGHKRARKGVPTPQHARTSLLRNANCKPTNVSKITGHIYKRVSRITIEAAKKARKWPVMTKRQPEVGDPRVFHE